MFFLPVKRSLNPQLNLRYTVHQPLKRPDLPQDLLNISSHVDFDHMSEDVAQDDTMPIFQKEKQILGK